MHEQCGFCSASAERQSLTRMRPLRAGTHPECACVGRSAPGVRQKFSRAYRSAPGVRQCGPECAGVRQQCFQSLPECARSAPVRAGVRRSAPKGCPALAKARPECARAGRSAPGPRQHVPAVKGKLRHTSEFLPLKEYPFKEKDEFINPFDVSASAPARTRVRPECAKSLPRACGSAPRACPCGKTRCANCVPMASRNAPGVRQRGPERARQHVPADVALGCAKLAHTSRDLGRTRHRFHNAFSFFADCAHADRSAPHHARSRPALTFVQGCGCHGDASCL